MCSTTPQTQNDEGKHRCEIVFREEERGTEMTSEYPKSSVREIDQAVQTRDDAGYEVSTENTIKTGMILIMPLPNVDNDHDVIVLIASHKCSPPG